MKSAENIKERIAIIGGTGKEGQGLAFRWAKAGYSVTIGSRTIEKAITAQAIITRCLEEAGYDSGNLHAAENSQAVSECDIAVLTVPYAFHDETILKLKDLLEGKYLLDVTVPLAPPKVSTVTIPPDGSIALHAQNILGDGVRVISAFQNISFELLLSNDPIPCDVLVCGVNQESRELGVRLADDAGLTAWDAGPLENSIVSEGLTSVLIRINKKYGTHTAGIKISGVPRDSQQ